MELISMLTLKPVIIEYGGHICLRCLNRRLGVHLAHRDTVESNPRDCACCKKTGSVVTGLKVTGLIKLLGKKM